jgi:hypothetical protein
MYLIQRVMSEQIGGHSLRQHLVSQRAPSSPDHQKAPLLQALLAFSTVASVRHRALNIRA